MEADGFVRRRRMTADTSGGDAAVAGASAGAEIHWLGGRFWGVSESLVGTLTPRIAGEPELHVGHLYGSQEALDLSEPDYEGLPQGASTSTHMLAGAVAGIMEHCLMFPIDCVKVNGVYKEFKKELIYRTDVTSRPLKDPASWQGRVSFLVSTPDSTFTVYILCRQ